METGSIPARKASPLALSPTARSTAGSSHSLGRAEIKHGSCILQMRPSLKASLSPGQPPAEVRHPAPRAAGDSGGPLGGCSHSTGPHSGLPGCGQVSRSQVCSKSIRGFHLICSPPCPDRRPGGHIGCSPPAPPSATGRCATLPERDPGPCCSCRGARGCGGTAGSSGEGEWPAGGHSPGQPHRCSIRWRSGEGVMEGDGARWDRNGANLCRVRSPALC